MESTLRQTSFLGSWFPLYTLLLCGQNWSVVAPVSYRNPLDAFNPGLHIHHLFCTILPGSTQSTPKKERLGVDFSF